MADVVDQKVADAHKKDIVNNQMVQTQDWYCSGCGRFLGKQAIIWGVIQVKCPNCKQWNALDISPDN